MNEKDLELEDLSLEAILKEFGSEDMSEPEDIRSLLGMLDDLAETEAEQAIFTSASAFVRIRSSSETAQTSIANCP